MPDCIIFECDVKKNHLKNKESDLYKLKEF